MPRVHQLGEELLNLSAAHGCRVPKAVKSDEGTHPMGICLLRPYAVMQITNTLAQLVEHLHRLRWRQRCAAAFHGCLLLYNGSVQAGNAVGKLV